MKPDQLKIFSEIEQRHWWFVARRQILARIVGHVLPPDAHATILDIGCGTGGNIGTFKETYRCIGVDASPTAIELAKQQHPGVKFVCAPNQSEMEGLAGGADMIIMTDVLEHVADDFLFLSRIVAAVQPKTYFILTVPADMSLWSKHDETVLHFRRYDEERFRAVWEGLPVETQLLSHFNSRLYFPVKFTRWMNRWRGRSMGVAGMDFVLPSPIVNRLLTRVFAGEANRLLKELQGGHGRFHRGVSLFALLRRKAGEAPVRSKPANIAGDPHMPEASNQVEANVKV